MDPSYRNGLAIVIFFGFASTAYHYIAKKKKELYNSKKQISDVIMFSDPLPSELVQSKFSRYLIHPSADRLMAYINMARYSLDICMYMITNCDIAHLIQKLHSRGVKIRLIVDADMAYASGSATKQIEKKGIELRWMKSVNYMHHKFCIIDASPDIVDNTVTPFIIIGSLNWTTKGLSSNCEDVLVTSKPRIVTGLRQGFENLWAQFIPIDK